MAEENVQDKVIGLWKSFLRISDRVSFADGRDGISVKIDGLPVFSMTNSGTRWEKSSFGLVEEWVSSLGKIGAPQGFLEQGFHPSPQELCDYLVAGFLTLAKMKKACRKGCVWMLSSNGKDWVNVKESECEKMKESGWVKFPEPGGGE